MWPNLIRQSFISFFNSYLYWGAWLRSSVLQIVDYAKLSCQRGLWSRCHPCLDSYMLGKDCGKCVQVLLFRSVPYHCWRRSEDWCKLTSPAKRRRRRWEVGCWRTWSAKRLEIDASYLCCMSEATLCRVGAKQRDWTPDCSAEALRAFGGMGSWVWPESLVCKPERNQSHCELN